MLRALTKILTSAALVTSLGCAGGDEAASDASSEAAEPAVTVRITQPADGATVGRSVRVVLETSGIEIVSITPPVAGTGHHHLYLDADLTPLADVIPAGNAQIVHKGDGSSEHTFEGLSPGPHRIIAVVANPAHIPLDPPVVDTVNFTVAN